jgi:hypothetical protein
MTEAFRVAEGREGREEIQKRMRSYFLSLGVLAPFY